MLLSQIRTGTGTAVVARDGTEAAIVEAAPFGLPLISPLAQGPRPGHGARHLTLKDMT
ncbi:hypothetical protein [Limimaricola cinnabarinus]|uniref:hypothetical protein n=1 Tax=Limimaricola cinnabarinus TaxID=1125964 RepID=UPI002490068A|nr:hypothetical protein [Limimaricola cinnabarinus]